MRVRLLPVVALAVAGWVAGGCLGYRLGTTLPAGISRLDVRPCINETDEPQVEIQVTRSVAEAFQRDGTLRLVDDGADAVLTVVLKEYRLDPVSYERDRPTQANEYRLTLRAHITFERVSNGAVLVSQDLIGQRTFILTGDIALAKRDALPEAADDLAYRIVTQVVEYW